MLQAWRLSPVAVCMVTAAGRPALQAWPGVHACAGRLPVLLQGRLPFCHVNGRHSMCQVLGHVQGTSVGLDFGRATGRRLPTCLTVQGLGVVPHCCL